MSKTATAIVAGLSSVVIVGAILGVGVGTIAVVATWIVRALT
jgi:hypothetical protein